MRKLSKKFLSLFIIGLSGLFWGREISDYSFPHDVRSPFVPVFGDTFVFRFVVDSWFSIKTVLLGRSLSEIFPSVVQGVMVNMICKFPIFTTKNLSSHRYRFRFGMVVPSDRETLHTVVPAGMPIPLIKPFKIFCAYFCVLALRERNKFVRLIKRLRYFVSVNTLFSHVPIPNRNLLLSRYFNFTCLVLQANLDINNFSSYTRRKIPVL